MPTNKYDIHVLNDLIVATLDSADRLDQVSNDSESTGHGSLFDALAEERRGMARVLQEAVQRLGGHADDGGSILAKAQRAMMDVRHALLGDEAGLIGSADRGEAALDRRFEDTLADARLSATTRETIRRAHAVIHRETDEIHALSRSLDSRRDLGSALFPQ